MRALGLIGPLAGWELRRLTRRGQVFRVWFLLLYVFLLAFIVFAAIWFYPRPAYELFSALSQLSSVDADFFTNQFALVLLEVQLFVVAMLTPALAASAVSEEKDRHTLPLLLTTQLTDREIVFGKAVGRIVFVLAAITSGLPVLMLTRFYGWVDVNFLLLGYAVTLGTVVLCAAIGVNAACRAPDFRTALLRAYGTVAVLVVGPLACAVLARTLMLANPFVLLLVLHRANDSQITAIGCGYLLVQLVWSVLLLSHAARSLRLREASAGPSPKSAYPLPPRPAPPPLLRPERAPSKSLPPIDTLNPVLWKERCMGWRPSWVMPSVSRMLALVVAAAAVVLFALGAWTVLQRVSIFFNQDPQQVDTFMRKVSVPDDGGTLLMTAGVFAVGRYLLPLAVGLSGTIAGERYRRTLDSLLCVPLDRRTILRAKVQAHAERGTAFTAVAVAAIGMAFTADGDIRLGASSAALVLGSIVLVLGLGAWLTVRCATDFRAFRILLLVVLLSVGWPIGLWPLLNADTSMPRELLMQVLMQIVLFAAITSALAGLVFWWRAERRLVLGE